MDAYLEVVLDACVDVVLDTYVDVDLDASLESVLDAYVDVVLCAYLDVVSEPYISDQWDDQILPIRASNCAHATQFDQATQNGTIKFTPIQ